MDQREETRDEIISAAQAAGHRVTRAQLRRWRRANLLGRARQRGRGKAAGSTSVYPPGTTSRVLAICALLPTHRAFPELAWELWLQHEDILPELVLGYLRTLADQHDAVLGHLRSLGFDRIEVTPGALALLRQVAESRYVPAALRARLGTESEFEAGRIETIVRATAQIMLGAYEADATAVLADEDSDGVMIARAADIDSARTDQVLGLAPWLPKDPSDQLELTAQLLGGDWVPIIEELTMDELGRARDRWQSFRNLLMSFGDAFGQLLENNIGGFPALAQALHDEDSESVAMGILCFLFMARRPELGFLAGLEQIESVASTWFAQGAPALKTMRILREEIPDFAEGLSPERLRAVISSAAEFDANNASLIPLAEKHEAAVRDAMRRAGFNIDVK